MNPVRLRERPSTGTAGLRCDGPGRRITFAKRLTSHVPVGVVMGTRSAQAHGCQQGGGVDP